MPSKIDRILEKLVNHEISLHDFSKLSPNKTFQIERFQDLLKNLNDPQENFFSIQVAGTNGKGSVVSYLESMFLASGSKVGAFFSPHLERVNERIHLSGRIVSNNELARYLGQLRDKGKFTFFEALTASAFLAFSELGANPAILETGLGGRLDSVTCAEARIGIITGIALDHQHILGNTRKDILREKAAIVNRGMDLLVGEIPKFLQEELISITRGKVKSIFFQNKDFYLRKVKSKSELKREGFNYLFFFPRFLRQPIQLKGLPQTTIQKKNFLLALSGRVLFHFREFQKNIPDEIYPEYQKKIEQGIQKSVSLRIPGRMESFGEITRTIKEKKHNIKFLFDGCHNPQGAMYLGKYLLSKEDSYKILFFSVFKDKKVEKMLFYLYRAVDAVFLWRPKAEGKGGSKFSNRWLDPGKVPNLAALWGKKTRARLTKSFGIIDKDDDFAKKLKESIDELIALGRAEKSPKKTLIIFAGSLSSYGDAKKIIRQIKEQL